MAHRSGFKSWELVYSVADPLPYFCFWGVGRQWCSVFFLNTRLCNQNRVNKTCPAIMLSWIQTSPASNQNTFLKITVVKNNATHSFIHSFIHWIAKYFLCESVPMELGHSFNVIIWYQCRSTKKITTTTTNIKRK